jgi:hypothetical protein
MGRCVQDGKENERRNKAIAPYGSRQIRPAAVVI